METVGLFDAKTHLSELIARAERGEETIITRHNKPVAKIVPMDHGRRAGARSEALEALSAFEPLEVNGATLDELVRAGRT
jgi:prevent-host-death family protein